METNHILKNGKVWGLVVGAFAGGFAIGYFLGKRDGNVFVVPAEVLKSEEVVSVFNQGVDLDTNHYEPSRILDYEEPDTTPSGQEELNVVADESVAAAVVVNVFANDNPNWDYDLEQSQRSKDKPYVISQAEYLVDEMDYRQETLTYYRGDDILADMTDTPLFNYKETTGELKFGHGSNDPNVVFVRNDNLEMEWEILLHSGRFQVEVLGFEAEMQIDNEIRHSAPMKFRSRD